MNAKPGSSLKILGHLGDYVIESIAADILTVRHRGRGNPTVQDGTTIQVTGPGRARLTDRSGDDCYTVRFAEDEGPRTGPAQPRGQDTSKLARVLRAAKQSVMPRASTDVPFRTRRAELAEGRPDLPAVVAWARVPFVDGIAVPQDVMEQMAACVERHAVAGSRGIDRVSAATAALSELVTIVREADLWSYVAVYELALSTASTTASPAVAQAGSDDTGSSPSNPPSDSTSGPFDAARHALVAHLVSHSEMADKVAEAVVLSVFPWSLTTPVTTLFAETPMWRQGPVTVDRVVDRLGRFADVAEDDDEAAAFRDAASTLLTQATRPGDDPLASLDGLVDDPWGVEDALQGGTETDPQAVPADRWPAEGPAHDKETIAELERAMLAAVMAHGSDDVGDLLGVGTINLQVRTLLSGLHDDGLVANVVRELDQLDERGRDIMERRILPPRPTATLEEIATDWGYTRERIRQLQNKLRKSFDEGPGGDAIRTLAERFRPALPDVAEDGEVLRRLNLVCEGIEPLAGALLSQVGPLTGRGGWQWPEDGPVARLVEQLDQIAEENPRVVPAELCADVAHVVGEDSDRFMHDIGFPKVGDVHAPSPYTKAVLRAALVYIGRPATKDEVVAALPDATNPRTALATLSEVDDIVRADKTTWWFADLVDDVYEGVPAEIEQRLDDRGGSASLAWLIEDISSRFDVTEGTVRAYANTSAYIIRAGVVSRADPDAYDARPPQRGGGVHTDAGWGVYVTLSEQHLSGFSLLVPFDVLYANGVRPGDSLMVEGRTVDTSGTRVADVPWSVIWRPTTLNNKGEVGRASSALAAAGFAKGDRVCVVATPDGATISSETTVVEIDAPQVEAAETSGPQVAPKRDGALSRMLDGPAI